MVGEGARGRCNSVDVEGWKESYLEATIQEQALVGTEVVMGHCHGLEGKKALSIVEGEQGQKSPRTSGYHEAEMVAVATLAVGNMIFLETVVNMTFLETVATMTVDPGELAIENRTSSVACLDCVCCHRFLHYRCNVFFACVD